MRRLFERILARVAVFGCLIIFSVYSHAQIASPEALDQFTKIFDEERVSMPLALSEPANLPEYFRTPFKCTAGDIYNLRFEQLPWKLNIELKKKDTVGSAIYVNSEPSVELILLPQQLRDLIRNGLNNTMKQANEQVKTGKTVEKTSGAASGLISLFTANVYIKGATWALAILVYFINSDEGHENFMQVLNENGPKIVKGMGDGSRLFRYLVPFKDARQRNFLKVSFVLANPDGGIFDFRCYYALRK